MIFFKTTGNTTLGDNDINDTANLLISNGFFVAEIVRLCQLSVVVVGKVFCCRDIS
jgi:hypothetical protein